MAWIEKREGKNGVSYRISVSCGIDRNGKQIMRRMSWKPSEGMTPRQIEKSLNRAASDFERSIEQGFLLDQKQTFAEYAAYVIGLKERTGVRPRTIDRYQDLLVRINKAIGHMKLSDLRPQHLNAFYKNLGEQGIRCRNERGVTRIDLTAWLKKNHLSRAELSRRSHVSASTMTAAVQRKAIRKEKAEAIATAMGEPLEKVFDLIQDTTPLSSKTILEYHRLISTIMSQAEKELLIPYNPAQKATPPKADKDEGIITIERALLYSTKRGVYEGPPKNGRSRTIKLAPETIKLLRQHKLEQERLQMVLGDRWIDSGYVFTQENGDRMNPDSITDWLNKFSKANGLPHIHPHAFRHTAASTMIANGIDLVTTANELGHANATTTATIYAHQIATAKAKASEVRSGVFRRKKEDGNT